MKRIISALLIVALLVLAAACAAKPSEPKATPKEVKEPVVVFTDPVLEELIRKAINRPEGDITLAEAETITALNLEMEGGTPIPRIEDLSDITQFPNLTSLQLGWALYEPGCNMDISPLAALEKLECLYICCDNISDISALSGLTNMKDLWIWGNEISDISPLSGMTDMVDLWIKTNRISDISALSGMKNLVRLYMENNQIEDLSPLAELPNLRYVLLSGNPVTDYSPLANVYPNLEEKDFEIK
jgi:internalin A